MQYGLTEEFEELNNLTTIEQITAELKLKRLDMDMDKSLASKDILKDKLRADIRIMFYL